MKQQRLKFKLLALVLFGMFALLAAYGGYSVFTYGNRWFASAKNPRVRDQKQTVLAGDVLDANGVVLATNDAEGNRVYQADEAARRAIVHLLGDSQGQVSNGVETFQTSYLYGFQASLPELIASLFSGSERKGDTVQLTVDSKLCTSIVSFIQAQEATRDKHGAAVVLNYKTGAIAAMVSLPSFDPMNITAETAEDPGQPYWNRATQALLPPGSTFKTVTTVSALQNLTGVEDVSFECTGSLDFGGSFDPIYDYGLAQHGSLSLKTAFMKSCNIVYGQLAMTLSSAKLKKTAESFGFNDNFVFRDLVVENSAFPLSANEHELAASGFGQSAVVATPLHMCMVAASIANGGVMMEPRLLLDVTSATGVDRLNYTSKVYRTPITPEMAEKMKTYMRAVVTGGTGSRAAVEGLKVCGKTGSADTTDGGQKVTDGWFIGFIDDADYPYAVCVLIEDIGDGTGGGATAAPIAGKIFSYIKNNFTPESSTKEVAP